MAATVEVDVSRSVDIVHVGDEFLIYVTLRNGYQQPVTNISVTYDLPKGFLIRMEQPQDQGDRGWLQAIGKAIQNYLYLPSIPETVFKSKRSMAWSVNILPGESYTINLPVRAGAFFPPVLKPDTYHLMFEIGYTYDEQEHNFQAKSDLILYPHIGGIFLGSILGGIIGTFLRSPQAGFQFLDLLVGGIAGLVLSIVFRRKANVQSFIAIEDFWGGFLIGIIAGYGGQDILNRFLTPEDTG